MATRRWDDPWQRYAESVPLPVEDGLATSKQRGAMATTWWSQRLVDVLESYGLGSRMRRGRRYTRAGQVLSLDVQAGMLVAQVQGSRRTPYVVTVASAPPSPDQWVTLDAALGSRVGFVAQLLAGEVPHDLEDVFRTASVELFPGAWSKLDARCNCPDWESPCKHMAAVLYVFADRLDDDPWLLLAWRGRSREQLLEPLRARAGGNAEPAYGSAIAPWWPFGDGERLPNGVELLPEISLSAAPDPPDAVLRRLEPLEVEVRGALVTDLLSHAYETVCSPDTEPPARTEVRPERRHDR